MKRIPFLVFVICALFVGSSLPAGAESQTWKLRPGDSLDTIAATLEIPREEIRRHNTDIVETHLQIGQKLKLPLRSFAESRVLEAAVKTRDAQIGLLARQRIELDHRLAAAEAQLRWHPLWFWGFWFFFGVLACIAAGAFWLFRETHPRVFEHPRRERSIRDLRQSQSRTSTFPHDDQSEGARGGRWQPPLKRLPHAR